ncbi:hypothetical protein HPB49_021464 [Dermacentor silvarum]|uniref:Uncharacterized protein n=1 Tax=Dermacentor silvarum TaxID=543639 RepID=A0ACB8D883_DERSI|nr:hypothetical protein HPB49_021464 [Dermacentor silvarum]
MFSDYRVDAVAKAAGHDVVRLPPYLSPLNPFELIWSEVEGYAAANSTTDTLAVVEKLLQENINVVTADKWLKACSHVQRIEDEFWQRDGIIDANLNRPEISLLSDTSSESDASDSEMSGMAESL